MSVPNKELCKKIFDEIDADHSGKLDINEIVTALNKEGAEVTKDDVIEIINLMDNGDPDGEMDFDEFLHFVYICENADMSKGASILFYLADEDFSGEIDQDEFYTIMKKLGEEITKEEIAQFFKENNVVDTHGMNYETFMKYFDEWT